MPLTLVPHHRPGRQGRFDRNRLPDPLNYFQCALDKLTGRGPWRSALCPFHTDQHPSLRVNIHTGGWRCMACDARGDLVAFHQRLHGQGFIDACKALGAWVEGHDHV